MLVVENIIGWIMSEDLAAVEEEIRMLRELTERLDEGLHILEDTVMLARETYGGKFEAKVRYLGASFIVTIPVKLIRELGIKLGESSHPDPKEGGWTHIKPRRANQG